MDAVFSSPSAPSGASRSWLGSLVLLPICAALLLGNRTIDGLELVPAAFDAASAFLDAAGARLAGVASPDGATMGGFLLQLLVPGAFLAFFARYRSRFGMQVFLVWLGHNLLYLGRIDSETAGWKSLLGVLGLSSHDYLLWSLCVILGAAALFIALLLPALTDE